MDTFDIHHVLSSSAHTRKHFIGVYASNRLPSTPLPRPAILVVNLDEDFNPGSHWVAFYLPQHGQGVEYFDSLGDNTCDHYFSRFMAINGGVLSANSRRLQSDFSDVCGEFCCVFASYCSLGYSLPQFVQRFCGDSRRNDRLAVEIFNRHFSCNTHYARPSLRKIHAQTCSPLCHKKRDRCVMGSTRKH